MGLTNFPYGLSAMGSPVTGGTYITTGNVYFVNSVIGSNDNNGLDPDHPVATIGKGISLCTSGQGDTVFVMPKHAETISSSTATVRVSGVNIIGLGEGTDRPTVTLATTASAKFGTSGAHSTYIENLLFKVTIDACVAPVYVESSEVWIFNCEVQGTSAAEGIDMIHFTSDADYCVVDGLKYVRPTSLGGTEPKTVINFETTAGGSIYGPEVRNCYLVGESSEGLVAFTSNIAKGWVHHNMLHNVGTNACIFDTSSLLATVYSDNIMLGCSSDSGYWINGSSGEMWSLGNLGAHYGSVGANVVGVGLSST